MSRAISYYLANTGSPSYRAAPLAAYEGWRAEYIAAHPTVNGLLTSASKLRRIVQLHRAGDSFAEIARCCGFAHGQSVKLVLDRLPENLR